jgi:hypothetical protein
MSAMQIDLEFDTGTTGAALLGDIASSLVSLDELLRDLAGIAAYPASVEFRKVEIVAIEMRSPFKVTLALSAIAPEAVAAFQEICRHIIRVRERQSDIASAERLAGIRTVLEHCIPRGMQAGITELESHRLCGHILTLQDAAIPLKRIEVKAEPEFGAS